MPEVRRATPDDVDAIAAVEASALEAYRQHTATAVRKRIAKTWVCPGRDGEVAGVLVLEPFGKALRITEVATDPRARGQGIGGALLARAELEARRAGATTLEVDAEELDPRLVAWYEGLGFARIERIPDFFHAGCGAIRLARKLE